MPNNPVLEFFWNLILPQNDICNYIHVNVVFCNITFLFHSQALHSTPFLLRSIAHVVTCIYYKCCIYPDFQTWLADLTW